MRPLRDLVTFWVPVILVFVASTGLAQDTVITRNSKGVEIPRKGRIVDWQADTLTIEINGRQRSIRGEEIIRFETLWSREYHQAEKLLETGKVNDALTTYRMALDSEQRDWARNIILARMVQCGSVLERHVDAANYFIEILRTDPQTRFLNIAPLPWLSAIVDRGLVENARIWMRSRDTTVKLMGASWLLGSELRNEAEEALTALSLDLDPDVAHLAKLQLWRAKVVNSKQADLDRLSSQIERMPKSLRAPALLIQSDIQLRLDQENEALLTLMRIPILHSEDYKLSAAALLKSSTILQELGQPINSIRLLNEIESEFSGTRFALEAASRRQAIQVNQ